jgi:hypothetical protein
VLEHGRETAHLVPLAVGAAAVLEVDLRPPSPRGPQLVVQTRPPDPDDVPPPFFPGVGDIRTDEGVDRIRLATLWLTSPIGTREGSDPDGTWRPYVEHRIRRNLAYEVTGPALRELPPLPLSVPGDALAGGAGSNILRSISDDLRSRLVETEALLSSVRTRGRFVAF